MRNPAAISNLAAIQAVLSSLDHLPLFNDIVKFPLINLARSSNPTSKKQHMVFIFVLISLLFSIFSGFFIGFKPTPLLTRIIIIELAEVRGFVE